MKRRVVVAAVVLVMTAAVPATAQEPPITLEASSNIVTAGEEITLSGVLSAGRAECLSDRTILAERTVHGSGLTNGITLGVTDESGAFSGTLPAQVSADYAAIARSRGDCPATDFSDTVTVLTRARVSARAASDRVPQGMQGAIAGDVHPGHPGTNVILQRRADGVWRNASRASLGDTSQFRFEFEVSWKRYRTFRVIWKAQDEDHIEGRSARIRIFSVPAAAR
jgi:hypothetical protein